MQPNGSTPRTQTALTALAVLFAAAGLMLILGGPSAYVWIIDRLVGPSPSLGLNPLPAHFECWDAPGAETQFTLTLRDRKPRLVHCYAVRPWGKA